MSASAQPRPPPLVPDYEVLCCIGRGAYGEVWLARSTLGALRAIKVIHRDAFDSDRPYLREFAGIREFEPVSAHESQVRVYHVGQNTQAGYFYYVMDLADDASLAARAESGVTSQQSDVAAASVTGDRDYVPATLSRRLLERGRLPVNECLDIAAALASALNHLHEHSLVHRDIKPANIVFVNGRPKLADIGLVASSTSAHTFVGTAGYIPPEGPGRPQADIYSFGKVLYEMAVGRDRGDFPQLPEGFAALPEREELIELNEVILKACQNDPAQRYVSAAELLHDLERLQLGESLRLARIRRKWTINVATCLAMLGVAVGAFFLRRSMSLGHRTKAVQAGESPAAVLPRTNGSLGRDQRGNNYTFTTLAGGPGLGKGAADGSVDTAKFNYPQGIALDTSGNIYVADSGNSTIRKISPSGTVITLAGVAGQQGSADGVGSEARFKAPSSVAVDKTGNIFVADRRNQTIRKITSQGMVSTLAGLAGVTGTSDGVGNHARFWTPSGIGVDSKGNLFVAEQGSHVIRKVSQDGVVQRFAGASNTQGGVDGVGIAARFTGPWGIAVDGGDNVYVAEISNKTIRKITPAGAVTTLAGVALNEGFVDGIGGIARFDTPVGICVDESGNIFVSEMRSQIIRELTPAGIVTTIGGSAMTPGYADGPGAAARFNQPYGMTVDRFGTLFMVDSANHAIRRGVPRGAQ